MASTIRAPVGSSESPQRWVAVLYLVGSVMGAIGVGAALAVVGHGAAQLLPLEVIVLLIAIVGWRAAMNSDSWGWPERRQQIPRWWVQPATPYGLLLAGITLGSGVFTHVRYALFYVVLASIVVAGAADMYMAVAIGATYGVVNGATPLLQTGTREQLGSRRYNALLSSGALLARLVAIVTAIGGIALFSAAITS